MGSKRVVLTREKFESDCVRVRTATTRRPKQVGLLLLERAEAPCFFNNQRIPFHARRDFAPQVPRSDGGENLNTRLPFEKPDCSPLDTRNRHPFRGMRFLDLFNRLT